MDAVRGRLHGHAAAGSHPGHRAHPASGHRSMGAIEAVQAPEELGFEAIDRAPDVDQILAQRVRREVIDGLADQCVDGVIETVSSPPGSRTLPCTDYTKHLFAHATDNQVPWVGYSHFRQQLHRRVVGLRPWVLSRATIPPCSYHHPPRPAWDKPVVVWQGHRTRTMPRPLLASQSPWHRQVNSRLRPPTNVSPHGPAHRGGPVHDARHGWFAASDLGAAGSRGGGTTGRLWASRRP